MQGICKYVFLLDLKIQDFLLLKLDLVVQIFKKIWGIKFLRLEYIAFLVFLLCVFESTQILPVKLRPEFESNFLKKKLFFIKQSLK